MRSGVYSLPLVLGIALLALWYGLIHLFSIPAYLLPTPGAILEALWQERHFLFPAASRTALSALAGFATAVFGGYAMAMLLAFSPRMKQALFPWILMLQMIPVIVLIPIFVLWLGPGRPSVMAITFMISFFPIVANTTLGLVSTERNLVELFTVNRASRWQEIFWLRMPYALPHFLTGLKIAATLAPIGAITGEFLAGTTPDSLGYLLNIYRADPGKTAEIFAVALLSCLLGFLFVGAIFALSWMLLHRWHDSMLTRD